MLVLVADQFVIQVRFAIRSAGQVRPHLIMIIQIWESVRHQGRLGKVTDKHIQALIVELYSYSVNMSQVSWQPSCDDWWNVAFRCRCQLLVKPWHERPNFFPLTTIIALGRFPPSPHRVVYRTNNLTSISLFPLCFLTTLWAGTLSPPFLCRYP